MTQKSKSYNKKSNSQHGKRLIVGGAPGTTPRTCIVTDTY